MSQWKSLSWPLQTPAAAALPKSSPEKTEPYTYNLPPQKFMKQLYLPNDFDTVPDLHTYSRVSPAVNQLLPHPDMTQTANLAYPQPLQSRTPQVRYPPPGPFIPNGDYAAQSNFHGPGEKWDPMGLADAVGGQHTLPKQDNIVTGTSPPTSRGRVTSRNRMDTQQAPKVTKRSRMGCLTCRQRKKRCCETRPKCTECERLRLTCHWPKPGTEHKNKSKEVKNQENMIDHDVYGRIKVLRGIVEYRSNS